jgi:hypothetical protein
MPSKSVPVPADISLLASAARAWALPKCDFEKMWQTEQPDKSIATDTNRKSRKENCKHERSGCG